MKSCSCLLLRLNYYNFVDPLTFYQVRVFICSILCSTTPAAVTVTSSHSVDNFNYMLQRYIFSRINVWCDVAI